METMNCTYLDGEGKTQIMEMGCYGIGVSRIVGAAIEQISTIRASFSAGDGAVRAGDCADWLSPGTEQVKPRPTSCMPS